VGLLRKREEEVGGREREKAMPQNKVNKKRKKKNFHQKNH
jgi:hypothetical protein